LAYQSGDEDDLPRGVTGLELGERRSNVVERVGALDRDDGVARRDRLGEFGQGRRARRGRAAVALDAVLLDRGKSTIVSIRSVTMPSSSASST
jgi:hypothetical protein